MSKILKVDFKKRAVIKGEAEIYYPIVQQEIVTLDTVGLLLNEIERRLLSVDCMHSDDVSETASFIKSKIKYVESAIKSSLTLIENR